MRIPGLETSPMSDEQDYFATTSLQTQINSIHHVLITKWGGPVWAYNLTLFTQNQSTNYP